jgi:hypothetical protein
VPGSKWPPDLVRVVEREQHCSLCHLLLQEHGAEVGFSEDLRSLHQADKLHGPSSSGLLEHFLEGLRGLYELSFILFFVLINSNSETMKGLYWRSLEFQFGRHGF